MSKNIGVLLSGSGVYDGSEIQEAVFALLAIDACGGNAVCIAPNMNQYHVVNHLNGEEMAESRNVLIESARIARGNIRDLATVTANDLDALVIPGGFGAAKNLTTWAFSGPDATVVSDVKRIILEMHSACKPLVGLCMGPTVIAKAFEGSSVVARLTVGTTAGVSPYEIDAISKGLEQTGAVAEMCPVTAVVHDVENKIITAPCYMMEASISMVQKNVKQAIDKLFELL